MYEPSRYVDDFDVAGFRFHDGMFVLDRLRPGAKLDIVEEFDNPYDPNALALYFEGTPIGYIPRAINSLPAQMIRFGHKDVFEVVVSRVAPEKDPSRQVRAVLRVADARRAQ